KLDYRQNLQIENLRANLVPVSNSNLKGVRTNRVRLADKRVSAICIRTNGNSRWNIVFIDEGKDAGRRGRLRSKEQLKSLIVIHAQSVTARDFNGRNDDSKNRAAAECAIAPSDFYVARAALIRGAANLRGPKCQPAPGC